MERLPVNQRIDANRRRTDRFAVERDVRFKVTKGSAPRPKHRREAVQVISAPTNGVGKTLNVSSAGVLFSTGETLAAGSEIEVSIDWPVDLNASCALRLVGRGRVVRTLEGQAAVHVQNYEFKTQPKLKQ
jgi:hypothetical protein